MIALLEPGTTGIQEYMFSCANRENITVKVNEIKH